MKYRTLGKTNIPVSVVGIETHQWSGLGGKIFSEREVSDMVAAAAAAGVNVIDTGECYRDHEAERMVGAALSVNGVRTSSIVGTKFGHRAEGDVLRPAFSAAEVSESLEASLRALRTDYVDIYYAHLNTADDAREFLRRADEVGEVISSAHNAGKVRFFGVTLGDNELLADAGEAFRKTLEVLPVSVVEVLYNRLTRVAEETVLPLAREKGIGVVTRVPLAKGYLSSRFRPPKEFDQRLLAEVDAIRKKEVPQGVDPAEWAIAWCLSNAAVSTVVPGCTSVAHVLSTVRAVDLIQD